MLGLEASHIACPVRIVWGTADKLHPWPQAAARYRTELPRRTGCSSTGSGTPQLDVPLQAAQLILGFTTWREALPRRSGSAGRAWSLISCAA
jgi:pimeloyl-ACP methyl ester carboxylesterase